MHDPRLIGVLGPHTAHSERVEGSLQIIDSLSMRMNRTPITKRSNWDRVSNIVDRNAILLLAIILLVIAFSRFFAIYNDPPWWMHPDFFNDEGWWADSARGKLFFNNYFADDFGTGYLVAPAYTFLLQGVYSLFGIGLVQTRMASSVAGVLTILVMAVTVWKKVGRKAAVLCALLLGASPFFWAFNRVAHTETLQTFFITSAFCLYMLKKEKVIGPFFSGLLLSISIGIKINAAVIGLLPVFLAVCATSLYQAKMATVRMSFRDALPFFRPLFWGFLGLASGIAIFLALTVVPNWKAFRTMVFSEAGLGGVFVEQIMTLPGAAFTSVDSPSKTTVVWRLAVLSPAVCFGAWLCILRLVRRIGKRAASPEIGLDPFEVGCIAWMLATWFFISLSHYQPDRRFVILLVPMALTATILMSCKDRLQRRWRSHSDLCPKSLTFSYFVLWLLLSLPVFLLVKPVVTNMLMNITGAINIGEKYGLGPAAAGTVVTFFWLLLLIPISKFRITGQRIERALLSKVSIVVFLLFLVCEIGIVGIGMGSGRASFFEAQDALKSLVQLDQTVLGHAAASAFQPYRVRTVRRSTPTDGSPPPNPDIWDRTHPRYIIELEQFNYQRLQPQYQDLISEKGYSFVSRFGIGPERRKQPRFVISLYKLRE